MGPLTRSRPQPAAVGVVAVVAVLAAVVVVFTGIRFAVDVPHLLAGTSPEPQTFEARYVAHPATAYLHLVPGTVLLLGAPLQLSTRFRRGHLQTHRRLGRVLLVLGVASGCSRSSSAPGTRSAALRSRSPRWCSGRGSSPPWCWPSGRSGDGASPRTAGG